MKVDEIRLQLFLLPRVSDTVTLSRASVADNLSTYARIAEENLSARAATVESAWFADSAREAEGNVWLIPNKETTEAVVERANVTTDKEIVRLCKIAGYAEILKIGQFFLTSLQETVLECSAHFAEMLTDEPAPQVDDYFEESVLEAKLGRSKRIDIFHNEGCWDIDVKVPNTSNSEILVWVSAGTDEIQNCRQIAAINKVILKENQKNETPESSKRCHKESEGRP